MDARHLRNLWLFSLLAQEMSFTKAAAVAGMSQPLFSRHIQALEIRLGKPVVKRLPRRIELTSTGRALAPLAKRLAMTLENYEAEVEKTASGEYDQVNLGSVNWAMHLILPEICTRIRRLLPHLSLKVHEISSSYAVEMLKRGDLDFAFCYVFLDRDPELDYLHYKAARKPLTFSHGEESRSARKRGIFLLTQACRKRASPICDSKKGVKRAEAQAHGRYQDAVPLLCRADEVHSLCGIAPLISDETESVAIRRLFVRKDEIRWSQKL